MSYSRPGQQADIKTRDIKKPASGRNSNPDAGFFVINPDVAFNASFSIHAKSEKQAQGFARN